MLFRLFPLLGLLAVSSAGPLLAGSGAQQPESYDSARVDDAGNLVITKAGNQTIVIRREGEQTSFSAPKISSARTAVAAQAMFPNCCTSYDIPLELVVYGSGKVHRFKGIGLPIFEWGFVNGGTRVAFGQTTVHFGCETHYELREIASERLIDSADIPDPCGQRPNPKPVQIPAWIAEIRLRKARFAASPRRRVIGAPTQCADARPTPSCAYC